MKKNLSFIPYKTMLITFSFTISATTAALCKPISSSSSAGLQEPPALGIDLYIIPMIIIGIIFGFFFIRKNTRV